MHPDTGSGVDVQLAVDDERISGVGRHRWREGGVVVDLEQVAGRILDLESFVAAGLYRIAEDRRVERHLCSVGVVHDVLMQPLVIGDLASTARQQGKRKYDGDGKAFHVPNTWSSPIRPSYSALPRMTADAPAAATFAMSSSDEMPPEY